MSLPERQVKSITEVARVAGVSTATVSRVINGLPGVRAEKVAQVRAAVDQLKYTRLRSPSVRGGKPAQRATAGGRRPANLRTGAVAVITLGHDRSWLERPVMAAVLGGIQRGATAHDLRLLLGAMSDPADVSPLLSGRQVDGAVLFVSSDLPIATYEAAFQAMQRHAPVVWAMGMEMAFNGVDHVSPDNVGIGYLAGGYLQRLGCQRPAFLTINPGWPLMRLRGQSFLNCVFDAGLTPTTYVVADDKRMAHRYGRRVVWAEQLPELVAKLVSADPRHDGLFVGNDYTMSYVYPLLAQHGVVVGRDMHVISCDAEEARLAGLHPRPASIDIGGDEIGFRAVKRLMNRIERPHGPPLVIQVVPRLHAPPTTATG